MENKVWSKIDSHVLVYGGNWTDAVSTIRAKVFGKMVELASDRISYYRSDLYHDALWVNEYITGPMQFDWIARESGTHIGEIVQHVKDSDCVNSARYRFDIREDGDIKWVLDTYQSILLSEVSCTGHLDGGGSLQHDGDTCPQHEIDTEEEFALPAEFHPYFSNEPLPESVLEAVANQDANPINAMIDMLFERPETKMGGWHEPPVPLESWADRHAALDIMECDVAFAVEGCIFHPAPVNGWTNEHVTVQEIPTLRNNSTEPNAPTRKENKMESIIRDLREKYEEASNTKDSLEEYQSNINDAVDELDTYMSDLDALIDSLDSLPEVSVYVDLDTVSFDS